MRHHADKKGTWQERSQATLGRLWERLESLR